MSVGRLQRMERYLVGDVGWLLRQARQKEEAELRAHTLEGKLKVEREYSAKLKLQCDNLERDNKRLTALLYGDQTEEVPE